MDIYLYTRTSPDESYPVGHMICPVVPAVGATIHLKMSLQGDWRLNPASPLLFNTAYFIVEEIVYEAFNVEDFEEGMGAAPYHEGSTAYNVTLYVRTRDEHTQVYIDRIIQKHRDEAQDE